MLEVCLDTPEGLAIAAGHGAGRIELCSALGLGGLTPSAGMMALAAEAPVPVYALIRPRNGDFVFSESDERVMHRDIEAAARAGLAGVVIGASLEDGRLDGAMLRRLKATAGSLGTTLHRAFDLVPDVAEAIDMAVDIGFERILTSGQARSAHEGVVCLAQCVLHAAGRISIMPGCGIHAGNVGTILKMTGVREVHASCRSGRAPRSEMHAAFGFSHDDAETDGEKVAALSQNMERSCAGPVEGKGLS